MKKEYEFSEWELEVIKILKKTKLVYTTLLHVNKNYSVREIQFNIAMDNKVVNISYLVGALLDYKTNHSCNGIVVKGGGMDMGFAVAYRLGEMLEIKGFTNVWL